MGGLYLPTLVSRDEERQQDALSSVQPTLSQTLGSFKDAYEEAAPIMGAALRMKGRIGSDYTPWAEDRNYVSPEVLNERFGIDGHLDFSKVGPRTENQAKFMYNRKLRELQRASMRQRDPGVAWAALGQDFVAGALDPYAMGLGGLVQVSKAVPGLSRLSSVAHSNAPLMQRAGAAFATTSFDASVGIAAMEPLNLWAHQQVGSDYTAANSLYTVTLGGLAAGALHAGGIGLASRFKGSHVVGDQPAPDYVTHVAPQTHEKALDLAIKQMSVGADVEVSPVIASDPVIQAESKLKNVIKQELDYPVLEDVISMEVKQARPKPEGLGYILDNAVKLPVEAARNLFGRAANIYATATKHEVPVLQERELTQLSGPLGSNEGGTYVVDKSGQKVYVKIHANPEQATAELAAHMFYKKAEMDSGLKFAPDFSAVVRDGKVVGVASHWIEDLSPVSPQDLAGRLLFGQLTTSEETAIRELGGTWVFDAWLGNRDVFGNAPNWNINSDGKGHYVKLDFGGSLEFRAQGALKDDFGADVLELQTMKEHLGGGLINATDGSVGAEMVLRLSKNDIRSILKSAGYTGDRLEKMQSILVHRQDSVRSHYPDIAKLVDQFHHNNIQYHDVSMASNWLSDIADRFKGLFSKEERKTLLQYQQELAGKVNAALWGKNDSLNLLQDQIKLLDSALEKAGPLSNDQTVTIWRKEASSWYGDFEKKFDPMSLNKSAYLFKGFMSSSAGKTLMSRDMLWKIDVEPGVNGIPMEALHKEIGSFNEFQGELEVLLPRNQLLVIDSVEPRAVGTADQHWQINARMINPDKLRSISEDPLEKIKQHVDSFYDDSKTFDSPEAAEIDAKVAAESDFPTLTEVIDTKTPMMKAIEEDITNLQASLKDLGIEAQLDEVDEVIKQSSDVHNALKQAWSCYLGH